MYATTKQARAIFKQVLDTTKWGSWTDKTSDSDPKRRSVSVCIADPSILPKVRALFAAAGFDQSVPKVTCLESDFASYTRGGTYLRVIAYME